MASSPITDVPTNIITGFLGVGKTTAILHLLNNKPREERWAVLVNEFGDIGIDGGLLNTDKDRVFIKEVPGGCMCCAAGLPMQVALNILLQQSKPDRLLIEPTGLGHPKEVLQTLGAQHYRNVLDVQKTITLIDARKITDARYIEHPIFLQQIEVADTLVANKSDLYTDNELDDLNHFLNTHGLANKPVYSTHQGAFQPQWLEGKAQAYQLDTHEADSTWMPAIELPNLNGNTLPECGYIRYAKQHDGFNYQGWKFSPQHIFNADKLRTLIHSIHAERIKGIFVTDQGVISFNYADDVLTEKKLLEASDSRLEIIARTDQSLDSFEKQLIKLFNAN